MTPDACKHRWRVRLLLSGMYVRYCSWCLKPRWILWEPGYVDARPTKEEMA